MILLHKYEETRDPDDGELIESDQIFDNQALSFKELIEELENYSELSQSHCYSLYTWASSESEMNFRTGNYSRLSLHYSRDNKTRSGKYWLKALNLIFKRHGHK